MQGSDTAGAGNPAASGETAVPAWSSDLARSLTESGMGSSGGRVHCWRRGGSCLERQKRDKLSAVSVYPHFLTYLTQPHDGLLQCTVLQEGNVDQG